VKRAFGVQDIDSGHAIVAFAMGVVEDRASAALGDCFI
jgi:hypothetical protein